MHRDISASIGAESPCYNIFARLVVRPLPNVVLSKIDAMPSDPAQALEPFRSYLEVLARVHLDPKLRGKLDPADVVQQVLLRAYAAWPEMHNPDQPALTAWLRRILARTLADVVKHFDRDKRAVDLERSLEADLDRSASGLAGWLAADQTSPSQAAIRNEEMLRLADALAALPEPQREVVVLKHLRGWTLQQIAEHLGRTVPAVASFLRRGLEDLRHRLAP
jgi:RNA polymerase sigma-70 factor (ECF subfamily)